MTLLERNYIDDLYRRTLDLMAGRHRAAHSLTLADANYTALNDDGYEQIVLDATALGADRTLDISGLSLVTRELLVLTLNAHGTYQLIIDAGASNTINGYRYWYLNGPYQYVRLRQVSATEWIVLDCLGTRRYNSDANTRTITATSGVWYNINSFSLALEAGRWRVSWKVVLGLNVPSSYTYVTFWSALSTSGAANGDILQREETSMPTMTAGVDPVTTHGNTLELAIGAGGKTLYIDSRQDNSGGAGNTLRQAGSAGTTFIEARRIA